MRAMNMMPAVVAAAALAAPAPANAMPTDDIYPNEKQMCIDAYSQFDQELGVRPQFEWLSRNVVRVTVDPLNMRAARPYCNDEGIKRTTGVEIQQKDISTKGELQGFMTPRDDNKKHAGDVVSKEIRVKGFNPRKGGQLVFTTTVDARGADRRVTNSFEPFKRVR